MKVKILLVQLEAVAGDINQNINKVKTLIESSVKEDIDLIILPELWTNGWDCPNFHKYSEEFYSSKTFNFLQETAVKYNSNIIGGSAILHRNQQKDRNTCIITDRKGNLVDIYDKFHLFSHRGQSEGKYLEEGDTPVTVKLDIGKIGISICYDIRFPELFRLYAFNDTDFMVNMAAWPRQYSEEYNILARARAIENQTYFISCCLTGKINEDFYFSGKSFVSDYKGNIIASLQEEEQTLFVSVDIDEMKQYRLQMPILHDTKKEYKIMEKL